MANYDLELCARIIQEDGFDAVVASGIEEDSLLDKGREVFKFLQNFYRQTGGLPSISTVRQETGVDLPLADEPVSFYIERIHNRFRDGLVKEALREAHKTMESGHTEQALNQLRHAVNRSSQLSQGRSKIVTLSEMMSPVVEAYGRRKVAEGPDGVLLPWEFINEMTWGIQEGEFWVIGARTGVGKCVAAGTNVPDPVTGIIRTVEEVVASQGSVFTFDVDDPGIRAVKPSAWIRMGTKECLTLRTRDGRSITVTPEHPMLTSSGWKKAEDLSVGDKVAAVGRLLEPECPQPQPEEEVDILAILLSEGGYSGHHTSFSSQDQEFIAIGRQAAHKLGLNLVQRSKYDYSIVGRRGVRPSRLRGKLFPKYGLDRERSKEKRIPELVFCLPNDQLRRFLMLFWWGDGSADGTITLASEGMIDDLRELLLRFGVVAWKRYKKTSCNGKKFDAWRLSVQSWCRHRFRELMLEMPGKKGEDIRNLPDPQNPNYDSIQVTDEMVLKIREVADCLRVNTGGHYASRGLYTSAGKLLGRKNPRQTGLRDFTSKGGRRTVGRVMFAALLKSAEGLLDEFGWMLSEDLYFVDVMAIEDSGEKDVYDLSVSGSHCFVAGGYYVHNTWLLICCAARMILDKVRFLFVSQEINPLVISQRVVAMAAEIPYTGQRKGRLAGIVEKKMMNTVEKLREDSTMTIVPPGRCKTVLDLEMLVQQYKPQIVLLDSFYMMKSSVRGGLWERIFDLSGDLKQASEKHGVGTVATTQLTRGAADKQKKGVGKLGTQDLSYGDAIANNADVVIFMERDEDMEEDNEMAIQFAKTREAEGKTQYVINWDLDTMYFDEKEEYQAKEEGSGDTEAVDF